MCSDCLVLRGDLSTFGVLYLCKHAYDMCLWHGCTLHNNVWSLSCQLVYLYRYSQIFIWIHMYVTPKVNGSSLNTKQSEHMVCTLLPPTVVSQESPLAHKHNNMNCHILCTVIGRLNFFLKSTIYNTVTQCSSTVHGYILQISTMYVTRKKLCAVRDACQTMAGRPVRSPACKPADQANEQWSTKCPLPFNSVNSPQTCPPP